MSYELSRLYLLIDKITLYAIKIGGVALLAIAIAGILEKPTSENIIFTAIIGFVVTSILLIQYVLCKKSCDTYKKYKLGDNEYPSVHICYTEGLLEVVHNRNYHVVDLDDIDKVVTFNCLLTVLVLVKSHNVEDSFHFFIGRDVALPFRKRLREEIVKRQHSSSSSISNQKQYRKLG